VDRLPVKVSVTLLAALIQLRQCSVLEDFASVFQGIIDSLESIGQSFERMFDNLF
jgi:hypothetical protein